MFKILFILFFVLITINLAYAQEDSLKEQLQKKIFLTQIQCPNSLHVLTERPNEKIACVHPSTAEKLDWKIINPDSTLTPSIFEVVKGDTIFNVEYTIKGGIITNMMQSDETNSLFITIDSNNDGEITLYIPHGVIDPIPKDSGDNWLFVLINGEEVESEQDVDDDLNRTVSLKFNHPDPEIELIAAYWI